MDTRDQTLTKLTRLHDESHPTPHRPQLQLHIFHLAKKKIYHVSIDLNLLCFHEYMCVLDPILQVYSHLLCVMMRQPRSDNNRDTSR